MSRLLIIPDLHGQVGLLNSIMEQVSYTPEKTIFLGDYIDDSYTGILLIDRLLELGTTIGACFLAGNHDLALITFFSVTGAKLTGDFFWL